MELPDDDTITTISNRIKSLNPDLIVLGFQEAKTYVSGKSKFLGQKLEQTQFLGQDYIKIKKSAHFSGITKGNQIFSKHAHQALQVMLRKNDNSTKVVMHKYPKGLLAEKGFNQAEITIGGKQLVFVSTHLEVKENKRSKDVKNIKQRIPSEYDAYFLMGDLNYRLRQSEDKSQDDILKDLKDPALTAQLIKTYDSFDPSHFTSLPITTWPQFDDKYNLPTYKRRKAVNDATLVNNIKKLGPQSSSYADWDGKVEQSAINHVYFPLKTKSTFWDLGWLDRIGYGVDNYSTLKVSPDVKLQVWSDIPFGDHTPVVSLFTISGL